MKTVKINFMNLYPAFNKQDNVITNILKEKYDVQITDDPDYLIFGCFGLEHINYDGIRIFFTGEDVSPDFNFCDYAIAFDRINFGDRYLRFPNFAYRKYIGEAARKHIFTDEEINVKTGFCNFIYSNNNARPERADFFKKLSEYKQVDSGGRYLNNIGGPVDDKIAFQKKYKFSIAFENDISADYTTEKILDAFAAKTVPIYWGNPNVTLDFNPKSFINCNDYSNFDEVIERVKEIDNDPELYRSILEEPIFKDGEIPYELSLDCLREFLFNIFDQPIEKAGRVSKQSYRKIYLDTVKRTVTYYHKIFHNPLVRKLYDFYIKITKK